ncbi:3-isopropylmalate dehydratase large subunit [bacterium]|nr:3-isopropylmalate dehydratase large subunit [bacterium]
MGKTIIEKILSSHSSKTLKPGDSADILIDARIARDFGGANVVNHLKNRNLQIDDPTKTFFTFDCNPGGSDQKYATNQHLCRIFARKNRVRVFDINSGIGTHIAIEQGLVAPGGTLVSTDSHANILGAIGAFGQGMGDLDIAAAFAYGKIWFKVPRSIKIVLQGTLPDGATAKDIVLKLLKEFGPSGLLGYASEFYGDAVHNLSISQRITISSMATEMAGIIAIFPPTDEIILFCEKVNTKTFEPAFADRDAEYDKTVEIILNDLEPLISRPGHPDDVVPVSSVQGKKIDSVFIGSCTNGRFEDMAAAARILKNKKVAPGVILKIVPSTRAVWQQCLKEGLIDIFMKAGALVGNPGCAGCAAGQIGQNGPFEVTVSTGNRNYPGKQGKGDVYLASPETAAASAVSGVITTTEHMPAEPALFVLGKPESGSFIQQPKPAEEKVKKPVKLKGRVWVIPVNNIDTDMIFHNRYLSITDIAQMGQHTMDNLKGWEDFSQKASQGDIIITGSNFGAGSSRQQAVDCFKSLGIQAIIAQSFGAIYERNAINAGLPVITCDLVNSGITDGEQISLNLKSGTTVRVKTGEEFQASPFSSIQMEIYEKGGLLT